MKSFSDSLFFLVFEQIVHKDRPKGSSGGWSAAGVAWQYSRHTFETKDYGFAMEVYEANCQDRPSWSFLVVKEH